MNDLFSPPKGKTTIYLPRLKIIPFSKKSGWSVSVWVERPDGTRYRDKYPLAADTKEEAVLRRNTLFTRLLLEGAQWQESNKIVKRDKVPKVEHIDDCIYSKWVKVRRWTVIIDGEQIGTTFSKPEARRIRDKHMKRCSIKRCVTCNTRAKLVLKGGRQQLIHDFEKCPNKVKLLSRKTTQGQKITEWNTNLRKKRMFVNEPGFEV